MSARGGGHAGRARREREPILPSTPLGAVIGKELRRYSRSVLRSVMLMISFLVGVLAAVIPAFSGKTTGLPFAGLGLAWGGFLCWRSVRVAQQRLESQGPEIFARARASVS